MLGTQAIMASAAAAARRLGGEGRWLLALPIEHIAGFNVVARAVLAGSAPTVLAGPLSASTLADAVAAMPPGRRYISLVPTQLDKLLADPATHGDLGSFDAILLGGSHTPPSLAARARALGLKTVLTYGMAETCGGCVYDAVPLDSVQIQLGLDCRIELAGPTLALGYVDPVATADGFVDRPDGRWFASSDQGHLDQAGRLTVLGRLDNVIQTGGIKVAPEQVERLVGAHPGVDQVVVVPLPDQRWGQLVTALVTGSNPPSLGQLRTWLKSPTASGSPGQQAAGQPEDPNSPPTTTGPHLAPRALGKVSELPFLDLGKPNRPAAAQLAQELAQRGLVETLAP